MPLVIYYYYYSSWFRVVCVPQTVKHNILYYYDLSTSGATQGQET